MALAHLIVTEDQMERTLNKGATNLLEKARTRGNSAIDVVSRISGSVLIVATSTETLISHAFHHIWISIQLSFEMLYTEELPSFQEILVLLGSQPTTLRVRVLLVGRRSIEHAISAAQCFHNGKISALDFSAGYFSPLEIPDMLGELQAMCGLRDIDLLSQPLPFHNCRCYQKERSSTSGSDLHEKV